MVNPNSIKEGGQISCGRSLVPIGAQRLLMTQAQATNAHDRCRVSSMKGVKAILDQRPSGDQMFKGMADSSEKANLGYLPRKISLKGNNSHGLLTMAVFVLLSILFVFAAQAANKCVGPSATGNGSGSDWNNQAAWGTFTPDRPSTNYVQDNGGTAYAGRTFTTAASGTLPIVIRKATQSEHGTDTGWTSSLGDQQILSGKIAVETYHMEFDGVTGGGPGQWTNNLGWKIFTTGQTPMLRVGPRYSTTPYSNIVFKHFELTGDGSGTGGEALYQNGLYVYNAQNVLLSYAWIYGVANSPFFLNSSRDMTNEFIWIGHYNLNTLGVHGEVSVTQDDSSGTIGDHTFRYMIITDHQSTGGIMWDNTENHNAQLKIYGCVFVKRSGTPAWGDGNNGMIGGWTGGNGEDFYNCKIYNNTFIDIPFGTVYTTLPIRFGNNAATNNLHYNINGTLSFGIVSGHNYNHFINAGGSYGEANGTTGTSNPFTDYPNLDFSLTANTTAGVDLGAPYNVDMYGRTRTTWTRGAIEFATADTTPPQITQLASNTPTATTATITWTTDDSATTWVDFGPTAGYGTSVSNVSYVTSHSIQITGLSASSLYHFRAGSTNSIPLGTNTADFTFTTAAADTTQPTVSITAPSASEIVSNTVSFTATASDASGIASVAFYAGGVSGDLLFTDSDTPYATTWNTRNFQNGTINLSAVATDNSGLKETNTISVTISNSALTGPIDWFPSDENTGGTTTDSISANIITFRNGATWGPPKLGTSSLSFDGINDRADSPISATLNQTNYVTVAIWVKITSTNDWQQFVGLIKETGAISVPHYTWHLFIDPNGYPQFQVTLTNLQLYAAESGVKINTGEWVHLAGVYNGSAVTLYVNGIDVGGITTGIVGSPMLVFNQELRLGATGLPSEFQNGLSDDLRIYDRALSASEIYEIYGGSSHRAISRKSSGGRRGR